jgi:hypothetical protein
MHPASVPHDPRYAPRAQGHALGMDRRPRRDCPPINPYAAVRGPDVPDADYPDDPPPGCREPESPAAP